MNVAAPIRILLSVPGDLGEESAIVERTVARMAREFAGRACLEFHVREHRWAGAAPKSPHGGWVPAECDIFVCLVWSRLGRPRSPESPPGSPERTIESETEAEFAEAMESHDRRGRPDTLVYRKTAPPLVDGSDYEALARLQKDREAVQRFFLRWFRDEREGTLVSASHSFADPGAFEEIFEIHLRKLLEQRAGPVRSDLARPLLPPLVQDGTVPFRGLAAFGREHAPLFFGRTRVISEILAAWRRQSYAGKAFVLILGGSGSGKSSLLRAGLIPMLVRPGTIERAGGWREAVFRPDGGGGSGCEALAEAVYGALPELARDGLSASDLAGRFRSDPGGAAATVSAGLFRAAEAVDAESGSPGGIELVVGVDQLEEAFPAKGGAVGELESLVEALSALAREKAIWVAAALRSDFFDRCDRLPALCDLSSPAGRILLPPMTSAELSQVIRWPALAAGLTFEIDPESGVPLDEVLLAEAQALPHPLPLLGFTLEELFHGSEGRGLLTFQNFRRLGGLTGSLGRRAERVFAELPESVRLQFDRLASALVTVSRHDEEMVTRRWAPWTLVESDPGLRHLVEVFAAARLFVVESAGEGREATVSLIHDALISHWERLREWTERERVFLKRRSRVAESALRWEGESRGADFLLARGEPLAEGEALLADRAEDLSLLEREFIRASQERAWAAARRSLRRTLAVAAALAVLAVVGLLGTWYGMRGRHQAEEDGARAVRSLAASLGQEGFRRIAQEDSSGSMAFLARALRLDPGNRAVSARAAALMTQRWWILPGWKPSADLPGILDSTWNVKSLRLAARLEDGSVQLYDLDSRRPVGPRLRHPGPVDDLSYEFSPDGNYLRTSGGGQDRVWRSADGSPVATMVSGIWSESGFDPASRWYWHDRQETEVVLEGPDAPGWWRELSGPVSALAAAADSPRGVLLFSDGRVEVRDLESGTVVASRPPSEAKVDSVAIDPTGTRVAMQTAAVESGPATIAVVDAATLERGEKFELPADHKHLDVLSWGGGVLIANAMSDWGQRLYSAETGRLLFPREGHRIHRAVGLDPKGRLAVVMEDSNRRSVPSAGKTALKQWRILELPSGRQVFGPEAKALHAYPEFQWSPDGSRLVGSRWDGIRTRYFLLKTAPAVDPDVRELDLAGVPKQWQWAGDASVIWILTELSQDRRQVQAFDGSTGRELARSEALLAGFEHLTLNEAAETLLIWRYPRYRSLFLGEEDAESAAPGALLLDAGSLKSLAESEIPLTAAASFGGEQPGFVATSEEAAFGWDAASLERRWSHPFSTASGARIEVASTHDRVVLVDRDGVSRVLGLPGGEPLAEFGTGLGINPAFLPDSNRLRLDRSRVVRTIRDLASGEIRHQVEILDGKAENPVFSPDGRWIHGTAGAGRSVLRDLEEGRETASWSNDEVPAEEPSAAFSNTGRYLVRSRSQRKDEDLPSTEIYETGSGGRVLALPEPADVSFSPDDRAILLVRPPRDTFGPKFVELRAMAEPDRPVGSWEAELNMGEVEWGSDGAYLALQIRHGESALGAFKYQVIEVATGRELLPAPGPNELRMHLALSPDGTEAILPVESDQIRIVNLGDAEKLGKPFGEAGFGNFVWAPDGLLIATLHGGRIQLWDSRREVPVSDGVPLPGGRLRGNLTFSGSGRRLVDAGKYVDSDPHQVLELPGMRLSEPGPLGNYLAPGDRWSLADSPDYRNGEDGGSEDAVSWDLRRGEMCAVPLRSASALKQAVFSPDGTVHLTLDADAEARFWDAATGEVRGEVLSHPVPIEQLGFNQDGRAACVAGGGVARAWDPIEVRPSGPELRHGAKVISFGFNEPGGLLITHDESGTLTAWDWRSGVRRFSLEAGAELDGLRVPAIGERILIRYRDGRIQTLSTADGTPVGEPIQETAELGRFGICGDRAWVFDGERRLRIHPAEGETGPVIERSYPDTWLGFLPDHRVILEISGRQVTPVDFLTGQPLSTSLGHEDEVVRFGLSRDKRWLATESPAGVKLWDLASGEPACDLMRGEKLGSLSRDGSRLALFAGVVKTVSFGGGERPVPAWLPDLLEAVGGQRVGASGDVEAVSGRRAMIERIHSMLAAEAAPHDPWVMLGKWFLADRGDRTIAPWTPVTIESHLAELRRIGSRSSLLEAESLDPGDPETLARLSVLLEPPAWKDSISASALAVAPEDPVVLASRVRNLIALSRLEEAVSVSDALVAVQPENDEARELANQARGGYHAWLGRRHYEQGEFERARAELAEAVQLLPNWANALNDLALVRFNLGEKEEALELWKAARAATERPWPGLHACLAIGEWTAGDPEKALDAYRLAIEGSAQFADPAAVRKFTGWTDRELTVLVEIAEAVLENP